MKMKKKKGRIGKEEEEGGEVAREEGEREIRRSKSED
jgi:hypothetical protein